MRRKGNKSSSSSTESTGNNNHLSTVSSASSSQLEFGSSKLFVKVYKEGDLIGRKLDLLALGGYHDLIKTLEFMFHPTIIGSEGLTYEDKEGHWMIVGNVPWESFLSTVKRLKITRIK